MEEQPARVAPPTFEYEAQMPTGSSGHHIFSLNFTLDNSAYMLSGPNYKLYWI